VTSPTLRRTLTAKDLALAVASMAIGSGIFLVPGAVIKQTGGAVGPALLVWLLGGVISLLGALTYGELSAARPEAGGVYVYIRDAFGPLPAFLFGWTAFWVIGSATCGLLGVAFASYLNELVPLSLVGGKVVAALMIAVVMVVNVRGARQGADLGNWTTGFKAAVLLVLAVFFMAKGHGFSRPETVMWPAAVSGSLFSSAGLALLGALWAYEGWQYITFSGGEAVSGQTIARGLLVGTAGVTVIYLLMNVGYVAALGGAGAAASDRIAAQAVTALFGGAAGKAITLVVMLSTFSAANGLVLTIPRVYYRMAKDGLFFRRFAEVHPRYATPAVAIVASCAWSMFLAVTGSFDQLLSYVVFVAYVFYGLGAVAVFVYRRRDSGAARPFSVPGYPVTPALFVLAAAALVINTVIQDPKRGLVAGGAVLLGVPVYYFWKKRG
jgi:APA family basic amino acid/polyamine antiporter